MDFACISISRKIQVQQNLVKMFSLSVCVCISMGEREFALTAPYHRTSWKTQQTPEAVGVVTSLLLCCARHLQKTSFLRGCAPEPVQWLLEMQVQVFHLCSGMSESMDGRSDPCVAPTCITVALGELSQARDLDEVFSAHSQRWDLPKRPCSPVGKTVSAHNIRLTMKEWGTDGVCGSLPHVKFDLCLLSRSPQWWPLSQTLEKTIQVWLKNIQWRNSTSASTACSCTGLNPLHSRLDLRAHYYHSGFSYCKYLELLPKHLNKLLHPFW